MRINHLLNSSVKQQQNTHTFNILEDLSVRIQVNENPYFIPLETLFSMAARMNKKRAFLFVSKILGKHLPVDPGRALLTGKALALRYMEVVHSMSSPEKDENLENLHSGMALPKIKPSQIRLPEETVFIGFAETATALGHAVFENFQNATFFHTTREQIEGVESIIHFEEEHSHATSHRCYIKDEIINAGQPVVLVDDEVTTGKTALNIIESIQHTYPRKEYTVISILDWRSEENQEKFRQAEQRLGIRIHTVSLLQGTMELEGQPVTDLHCEEGNPFAFDSEINKHFLEHFSDEAIQGAKEYLFYTGRFGMRDHHQIVAERKAFEAGAKLSDFRTGMRTLCLGTGEFMYLPMKIAQKMGDGVFYQSTTRSPIHPVNLEGYAVKSSFPFANPEDESILHHFYNVELGQYDEVFVFFEREAAEESLRPMLQQLKKVFPVIHLVFFNSKKATKLI
ncbi:phosphoribosyltransferase family protein [Metabacillus sp. RGM 3146]|uniref:phosphoribosyltransferase family protein n=1 Tax=Metabacillus sp. RGM 3146 TaxID=3401092 RepID=UPI003B9A3E05